MGKIYNTVSIIGPGLIGGSIGLGIKSKQLARRIVGVGRRVSSLKAAIEVGAIDEYTTELSEGVADADLIILATPVSTFVKLVDEMAGHLMPETVLTEVGSTKESVIKVIRSRIKPDSGIYFIPTHPMAGSEKRGAGHAKRDLFEGAACIFTPLDDTPEGVLNRLEHLWTSLGADVYFMSSREHDRLVARISHLPHILAAALINHTEVAEEGCYAGGGLLDTTRIAGGDPGLWRAICESNSNRIIEALESFSASLGVAKAFIEAGDFDALEIWLEEARQSRDELVQIKKLFAHNDT